VFGISEYVMSHAPFTAVLEAMKELAVWDGTVLIRNYTTARQKLRQVLLLQLQTKLAKYLQEVIKADLIMKMYMHHLTVRAIST